MSFSMITNLEGFITKTQVVLNNLMLDLKIKEQQRNL